MRVPERVSDIRASLAARRAFDRSVPVMPAIGRLGSASTLAAFRANALAALRGADALGDLVRVDLLYKSTIFVKHPDAVAPMFDTQDVWLRGEGLAPLLGRNVLTTNGAEWEANRRRAQPSFHPRMIERMADGFVAEAAPLVDAWARFAGGAPMDLGAESARLFAQVATRDFGLELRPDEARRFPEIIVRLQRWGFAALAGGNVRTPQVAEDTAFLDAIIARALAAPAPPDRPPSFLERIRQDHEVDRAALAGHLRLMLIAPADNPPNGFAFAVWALARHREVEEAVRREIRATVGDEAPTFEAVERMPLLDRALREALRVYPVVWLIARNARVDTELLGHRIPAGTVAWIPPYYLHRHPAAWEQPDAFRPDRFLPEAIERRHRHAYLPFGAGPRTCIGARLAMLQMRQMMVLFLQRFRAHLAHEGPLPLVGNFAMRSAIGLPVRLERLR